jgi:hypothetical protein
MTLMLLPLAADAQNARQRHSPYHGAVDPPGMVFIANSNPPCTTTPNGNNTSLQLSLQHHGLVQVCDSRWLFGVRERRLW